MVNTVDSNKSKYTVRQYCNARKAHALQDVIGRPRHFEDRRHIQAESTSIRGKTTRHPTQHVNITRTKVPKEILQKYGEVTLAIDIMAINKIPFMITTSRHIHFRTADLIHMKAKGMMMTSIHQVVRAYHVRGFKICNTLAEAGFECIRNNLADLGISLNVTFRNE